MKQNKNIPTVFEALKRASLCLREAERDEGDASFLLEQQTGWSHTRLVLHYRDQLSAAQFQNFQDGMERILAGEPAQYVARKCEFYGIPLEVRPGVLIPRQETEELVDWVLADNPDEKRLSVLDIGTGSGAIAIALKANRPDWRITGIDISNDALDIAKRNAEEDHVAVDFKNSNLFSSLTDKYDLIVSNPPYVSETEINLMDQTVLDYEPREALFADNNGLAVYQRISEQAADYLKKDGKMYFEIGFKQGAALTKLFKTAFPDKKVTLKQDVAKHDRMLRIK